jgi:hypothetical protein
MAGERDTKRATGAASAPVHRWAVDRIEEGTAAVEQDGDHVYEVPRYLLPPDARDGDVMSVTITGAVPGEVTISVRIDRKASAPPPSAKAARKPRRSGSDPGGDIVL